LTFVDFIGFDDRGDCGGDVIDFDGGGLGGDYAVNVCEGEGDFVGAVVGEGVSGGLTDCGWCSVAEVPAIGAGVVDAWDGFGGTEDDGFAFFDGGWFSDVGVGGGCAGKDYVVDGDGAGFGSEAEEVEVEGGLGGWSDVGYVVGEACASAHR
jgi:hypothetical protein